MFDLIVRAEKRKVQAEKIEEEIRRGRKGAMRDARDECVTKDISAALSVSIPSIVSPQTRSAS